MRTGQDGEIHGPQVMTVRGPIPVEAMGITLMHEHIMDDGAAVWFQPPEKSAWHLVDAKVDRSLYEQLRVNPYACRDNCFMLDVDIAIAEVSVFRDLGGCTITDVSCKGIGPFPEKLRAVSEATGVNIVMVTGFYYESSHPPRVRHMSIDQLADEMIADLTEGVNGTGIRAGILGEIGVSPAMTTEEIRCLRAATRASVQTRTPLTLHQPSFERLANRILDIIEAEGGDLTHTVVGHMCASGADFAYQTSLLERGAYVQYDLIGSDLYYPSLGCGQPTDEENAIHIKRLIDAGFVDQLLLSHDIFIKIGLQHYGGRGYGHIPTSFVPRLRAMGVTEDQIETLLVKNPQRVFTWR